MTTQNRESEGRKGRPVIIFGRSKKEDDDCFPIENESDRARSSEIDVAGRVKSNEEDWR